MANSQKAWNFKSLLTPQFLCVLAALVLRIPSLFEPYWYGDEGIYLTLGTAVRHGSLLYRDIFDHKTPAIYLVAALAGSLFWFKMVLLWWHLVSVSLFWRLCARLFEGLRLRLTVVATSVFVLLTTLPLLEGNVVNSELFMLTPTLAAFILVWDGMRKKHADYPRFLLAGLCLSTAFLFKVPAIFDSLALGTFLLISGFMDRSFLLRTRQGFLMVLGFLMPVLASVLYFWSQGALNYYFAAAGITNLDYISRWGIGGGSLAGFLPEGLSARAIFLGGFLVLLFFLRRRLPKHLFLILLWFAFSLFAALLSARPYPHYLVQITPALSVMLAVFLVGRARERFWPIPVLVFLGFVLVFYKFQYYPVVSYYRNFFEFINREKTKLEYFDYFDRRTNRTYKLASLLVDRTAPSDPVFIWGTAPELYALSRRVPPGRYTTSFHIVDFSGQEETMRALAARNPKYIIMLREEPRNLPGLEGFLQKKYIHLETLDGAEVWKLVNPSFVKLLND